MNILQQIPSNSLELIAMYEIALHQEPMYAAWNLTHRIVTECCRR